MFDLTENYKTSRKIASEGMVLLKNEGNVLPFAPTDRVGIIGKNCLDLIKGGGGSALVKCEYVRSLLDGLSEKEGEGKLRLTRDSFALAETDGPYSAEAFDRIARETDKVIVTYKRYGTEGTDRELGAKPGDGTPTEAEEKEHLRFYPTSKELSLFDAIERSAIQNVVLILNVSSTVDFSFIERYPKIKAVLLTYLPGMECGTSIADVLCGDVNPSGRLVDTVARDYTDYPSAPYFNRDKRRAEYGEGIFVGYRYFETYAKEKVLYPFGFGLSYTDYSFENASLTVSGDTLTAKVTVRNIGNRAGREAVQIYVAAPAGKLKKPALELRGFAKTALLLPGETETVCVGIRATDLSSFDDTGATGNVGAWVLEAGDYTVYAGKSVRDLTLCGKYNVKATRVTEQLTLRFDGSEYSYKPKFSETEGDGVANYSLYDVAQGKLTLAAFIDQLTPEELAHLALGQPLAFPAGTSGLANLKKYGIPNPQTADGPAGIRRSVNTTCFPCATLIACSWDSDLQFAMGKAMGFEGYSTGLDVLLGPALNIHRDVRGGRCFEYYSEDPLISGKAASAIVRHSERGALRHAETLCRE